MVFNWGVNVCCWYKAWLMMSKISFCFFSSKASKNYSVSGFFMILWIKCIRSIPIRCGLSKIHLSQVRREPLILEENIDSVTWFVTIWTNLDVITTTNREGLGRRIWCGPLYAGFWTYAIILSLSLEVKCYLSCWIILGNTLLIEGGVKSTWSKIK